MKTLFLSDLDGTLLNSKACVSDKTAQMLNEVISGGLFFTVATARTYSTVMPMFEKVSLTLPLVLMNGVCIYDPKERKTIDFKQIDLDLGKEILKIFYKHGKYPLMYYEADNHMRVEYQKLQTQSQVDYVSLRKQFYNKNFVQVDEFDFSEARKLIYCVSLDKKEELSEIRNEIAKRGDIECNFYPDNYCGEYFLEIFCKDVSKASGALQVKEMLGADKIVAFGDNMNDIPLFELADECYAVGNACNELKSIATGIIGTNNEDAVARFLYERYKDGNY